MRLFSHALSLKQRVTGLLLFTVLLFTMLHGILAVVSMHEQEDDLVDQVTLAEARRLMVRLQQTSPDQLTHDALRPAERFQAWWLGTNGQHIPSPAPAWLQGLSDGPHRRSTPQGEAHAVVMRLPNGRLIVTYDATQNEEKVHEFALLVFTLGGLVLLLALVLARHLAGAVVAPFERVTRQLERWAPPAGAVGSTMSTPAALDEETRLLEAFSRVQTRLEHELANEREFLANLRHELRTPLAAARTDLEMLALGIGTPEARQQRVQRALAAVDTASETLGALQALAARRSHLPASPVALARCVQDAWDSLGELPQRSGLTLRNDVPDAAQVLADRHALLTLLRNLMRNAAEHAAPACCRVHFRAGRILVEDDGPGLPPEELPLIFERHWRGRLRDEQPASAKPSADAQHATSSGLPEPGSLFNSMHEARGLGLAIARQMAEYQGWQMHAEALQPHGLRFVISPAAVLHPSASLTEI